MSDITPRNTRRFIATYRNPRKFVVNELLLQLTFSKNRSRRTRVVCSPFRRPQCTIGNDQVGLQWWTVERALNRAHRSRRPRFWRDWQKACGNSMSCSA